MTPKVLTKEITWLKNALADKSLPFGVDLAIPQIGGNARKTNHDYTHGHLPELIDIIVAEKVKLFICAVGVPPQWAVDKLHAGGVVIANMVGSVRNTQKALDAGVDIIIAQGTEGGGHTGDIGTMCLIPQVVDACRGRSASTISLFLFLLVCCLRLNSQELASKTSTICLQGVSICKQQSWNVGKAL